MLADLKTHSYKFIGDRINKLGCHCDSFSCDRSQSNQVHSCLFHTQDKKIGGGGFGK